MTTLVVGSVAVDMTTWAFTPGWKGGAHSANQFVISQKSTGKIDTFTGSGFGGWDSNGFPTTGTITGIVFAQSGSTIVTLSSFSMSVTDERHFASTQDMAGFQQALLAGDDDLTDGALNDHLFGLGGNDTFHMTHGGTDIAEGNDGNDSFDFADQLDADDQVDGGADTDTVTLNGDYDLTLNASTITNVENLILTGDHAYILTMDDGNVAGGATLNVDASALDTGQSLQFDGSAESDGHYHIIGSSAGDDIVGGQTSDFIDGGEGSDSIDGGGGADTAYGGNGFDDFNFGDHLGTGSLIDGGEGFDTLHLDGDYSAGVTFTMTTTERVQFGAGHSYDITLDFGSQGSFDGGTTVDGSNLGAGDSLIFDASHAAQGTFRMFDGAGDDSLTGGQQGDELYAGNGGDDSLSGSGGDDYIVHTLGNGGHADLNGGADNDTLVVNATNPGGTTSMEGGSGNDHFVIQGGNGDIDIRIGAGAAAPTSPVDPDVFISDASGRDTIDMRGANGPAVIDMATGGTVAGLNVVIAPNNSGGGEPAGFDLVFSQDLTGSFNDDLVNVRDFLPDIFDAVEAQHPDAEFGVTSFHDKGEPSYTTNLALTTDTDAVQGTYDSMFASGGGDTPEDQLEALQQLGLRGDEVGWNDGSEHVVLLFTDATFHLAGDGPSTPNNGDTDLDSNEDYPTIDQVRDALLSEDIIPIFAVTSDVTGSYEDLVAQLGFGTVVELAHDSSNVIQAIQDALDFVSSVNVIEAALGTEFGDSIAGNDASNLIRGNGGNDDLDGGKGNDRVVGGAGNDTIYGDQGSDRLRGSTGRDHIYGGQGDDRMSGGAGHDYLDGGTGHDIFHFDIDPTENPATDTINAFDANEDRIDINVPVVAIDEQASRHGGGVGALFSDLGAHHAQVGVLFPGGDDEARGGGRYFLAIDVNGEAGYQAGEDQLIRLSHPVDTDITLGSFV